jgi:hypothetical protein
VIHFPSEKGEVCLYRYISKNKLHYFKLQHCFTATHVSKTLSKTLPSNQIWLGEKNRNPSQKITIDWLICDI